MNIPIKLKHHIGNFVRFFLAYCFVAFIVLIGKQFDLWSHPVFIEWCLSAVYFLVAAWFVWRGYTGMVRDGDFYDEF